MGPKCKYEYLPRTQDFGRLLGYEVPSPFRGGGGWGGGGQRTRLLSGTYMKTQNENNENPSPHSPTCKGRISGLGVHGGPRAAYTMQ